MKRGGLKSGEAIFLLAAILLFAAMFVSWYGSEVSGQAREIKLGGGAGQGGSAWQTLDLVSLVLMLTVVVAVGAALLRLFDSKWEPAIPPSAAVAVLGGLSTLLVLFRIVVPPDFGSLGGVAVNAEVELGAFLGLLCAAGVAYGGYRAMGQRGTSFERVAEGLSKERPRPGPTRPAAKAPPRPSRSASRRRRSSSSD
ncbi:MAG: hypothetical protein ACOYD4_02565 [Solirubrobacterales bacterium]